MFSSAFCYANMPPSCHGGMIMRLLNEGFPLHLNSGFWGCDSKQANLQRIFLCSSHQEEKKQNSIPCTLCALFSICQKTILLCTAVIRGQPIMYVRLCLYLAHGSGSIKTVLKNHIPYPTANNLKILKSTTTTWAGEMRCNCSPANTLISACEITRRGSS